MKILWNWMIWGYSIWYFMLVTQCHKAPIFLGMVAIPPINMVMTRGWCKWRCFTHMNENRPRFFDPTIAAIWPIFQRSSPWWLSPHCWEPTPEGNRCVIWWCGWIYKSQWVPKMMCSYHPVIYMWFPAPKHQQHWWSTGSQVISTRQNRTCTGWM